MVLADNVHKSSFSIHDEPISCKESLRPRIRMKSTRDAVNQRRITTAFSRLPKPQ